MNATYRLQFHKDFSFEAFEKIIPYLKKLGVDTIYASPIFESVPGSSHGYDGINPCKINPEIGTEDQLRSISALLKEDGIKWLQDIVPNHMAFHHHNPWLMDVLEKGKQSRFWAFFDIDWQHPAYSGKIMLPFLGNKLTDVVNDSELSLQYHEGRLVLRYFESFYPLNPASYAFVFEKVSGSREVLNQLVIQLKEIHQIEDKSVYKRQWDELLLQLSAAMNEPESSAVLQTELNRINHSSADLNQIIEQQTYILTHWRETDKQINFRRFFTVNGLICINIENDDVFNAFHSYIKQLYDDGLLQGLRIDHIDGLVDPDAYLKKLRGLISDDAYLVVEKILEPGEALPSDWPVQGTTGYDFLAMVNNLFTDKDSEKVFTKFYNRLSADKRSLKEQIHEKKAHILFSHMQGELDNLCRLFLSLKLVDAEDLNSVEDIKETIARFLIHCPVYRYYANSFPLGPEEAQAIQSVLNSVRKDRPDLALAVGFLESVFLIKPLRKDEDYNLRATQFYKRCMQFAGPLMAKGVEDTLMYTYNRFIGHNEVGDSPEAFGLRTEEFHELMTSRQRLWPESMNATSTHDTKRGEDVRARLNVLTELGESWLDTVEQWQMLNKDLSERYRINANDEYFVYQTIVGTMPLTGQPNEDFESRLNEYLVKALREGKIGSDWADPDTTYEEALTAFASALLNPDKAFYKILRKFNRRIEAYGIINSLSQVLLKFTCPGVPDVYQGSETWDFSLVDPDNRRPVDYNYRRSLLEHIEAAEKDKDFFRNLWENKQNGQVKLWLIQFLLRLRSQFADVFGQGDYISLQVKGKYRAHVFAFARRFQDEWIVVVVPLRLLKLSKLQKRRLEELKWKNTRIVLPPNAPDSFENCLNSAIEKCKGHEIAVAGIFGNMPFSILKLSQPQNQRGAGILLHITSLPSPFGIGDFGPEARKFADYLSAAGQKYWQLLPLGLTEEGQGYSPYSAISAMAGNTMLISPQLLAEDGLMDKALLAQYFIKEKNQVNFSSASKIKESIFDQAYHNFETQKPASMLRQFEQFCSEEAEWLNDFALYLVIKRKQEGNPWYEWPEPLKQREPEALHQFAIQNPEQLRKVKWLQYIFSKQWSGLRDHCHTLGIKLVGDLPFYVSSDSSDVWANKEIFALDSEGRMTGVAGVPPDYFNDNGQLWGMPVFRWDVLKEQNYSWWIKRIRKNMQLYDLLRLDHFRAFSSYWEVAPGEETAKNGKWKAGPGSDFFRVLKRELGSLPFVAEDLGDVDEEVYNLRDEFNLPGMRVIQFSFGSDSAQSIHSPHNYTTNSVAYTGTHDNNTTRGWFKHDSDEQSRRNISAYSGKDPKETNIHKALAKMAYASVANIVILPMQDVLGLDESARMNTPASTENNWAWRLKSAQLKRKYSQRLKRWVDLYNRR